MYTSECRKHMFYVKHKPKLKLKLIDLTFTLNFKKRLT